MAATLTIAALLPTNFLILMGGILAARAADPANHLFHTDAEIAALNYLNVNALPDSIVLSDFDTGNYLPARASVRTVIGHGPETIRLEEKREQVRRFFDGEMTAEEQRAMLKLYQVRYIIFPAGRSGPPSPDYHEVWNQSGYFIYEVNPQLLWQPSRLFDQ